MKTRRTLTLLLVALALPLTAATCTREQDTQEAWNRAGFTVTVELYHAVYDFIGSEAGTEVMCQRLLDEHAADIAAGTYTEAQLDADCAAIIADFEGKFDLALNTLATALELWSNSLQMWDATDGNTKGWAAMTDAERASMISLVIADAQAVVILLTDFKVKVPRGLLVFISMLTGAPVPDNTVITPTVVK